MRKTALDTVYELAKKDSRVVFIGSDLGPGTLDNFKREMPERFFMEGVAEQNVIGMAAGMAMDGFIPFVNTIATFLTRRCFEQVALDLCLHNLPVRLIGNGGGLVYAPLGPTHLAIEDLGILRTLPNMCVVAPTDADEMRRFIPCTLEVPGPVYIRLAKGGDPIVSRDADGFEIGKAICLREPGEVLMVATGVMVSRCLAAAEALAAAGVACGVLNVHTVKPLDGEAILDKARGVRLLLTVEEHVLTGGLGSAVTDLLADRGADRGADRLEASPPAVVRLGIGDEFPSHYGSQDELLEFYGLQPPAIAETVRRSLAKSAA